MRKTLLTLAFSAFAFASAYSQTPPIENIYWKNVGSDNYVYASGGTANFYVGGLSASPITNGYALSNDTVVFAANPSIFCSTPGTYKISLVNDTLAFLLIKDDCPLRSGGVVGSKWIDAATLGLEENAMSSLVKIYPNPAVGSFQIDMPASNGRLVLYDAKGTNVMEKSLNAMNNIISTETLTKGIYHAQIMVDGQWIKTSTIVVQ